MNKVLILDFGSQYTQLIARRIREQHVYCEIHPCTIPWSKIQVFNPQAILLSGGPASVLTRGSPRLDLKILEMGIPLLGICYGMQLMAYLLGGLIAPSKHREYGKTHLKLKSPSLLFSKVPKESMVWMSHGDSILKTPPPFKVLARTHNGLIASMACENKKLYALQFHPEVAHTQEGLKILSNFLFKISKIKPDWTMRSFIKTEIRSLRGKIKKDKVLLGLSGGVDSSVAAVLIHKAIGSQLTCLFINNGLLRLGEAQRVQDLFKKHYHIPLKYVDASRLFLSRLREITDPEQKRKIIGKVFIEVFEKEAKKIKGIKYLAQGTLYPDVIESVSFKGPSAVIKSHHNVGGLPKNMGLRLVEPFRELFKDEVRRVGEELRMPDEILKRHPFPGPGLAVRILGEVTQDRCNLLRLADKIVMGEMKSSGWYDKVWQSFAVFLPVQAVGVMGDERTYENVCAVRVVSSMDGMTADWVDLPHDLLGRISSRIINEVRGINRVVYDISSKPPATIEWE